MLGDADFSACAYLTLGVALRAMAVKCAIALELDDWL